MHFRQVVAQRHLSLAANCVIQRVGRYIGVAVAVTANPLAHAQKAVNFVIAQLPFKIGIELWNLA